MFDVTVSRLKRARRLDHADRHATSSLVKISAPHARGIQRRMRAFLARNQALVGAAGRNATFNHPGGAAKAAWCRSGAREYRIVVDRLRPSVKSRPKRTAILVSAGARGEPVLRLQRFLIAQASEDLRARADRLSAAAGHSLSVACACAIRRPAGAAARREAGLNFCWRLIFAGDAVREYVVAHEVAHLKHMDHSPAFWAQCAALCPEELGHRSGEKHAAAWRGTAGTRWCLTGSAGR